MEIPEEGGKIHQRQRDQRFVAGCTELAAIATDTASQSSNNQSFMTSEASGQSRFTSDKSTAHNTHKSPAARKLRRFTPTLRPPHNSSASCSDSDTFADSIRRNRLAMERNNSAAGKIRKQTMSSSDENQTMFIEIEADIHAADDDAFNRTLTNSPKRGQKSAKIDAKLPALTTSKVSTGNSADTLNRAELRGQDNAAFNASNLDTRYKRNENQRFELKIDDGIVIENHGVDLYGNAWLRSKQNVNNCDRISQSQSEDKTESNSVKSDARRGFRQKIMNFLRPSKPCSLFTQQVRTEKKPCRLWSSLPSLSCSLNRRATECPQRF